MVSPAAASGFVVLLLCVPVVQGQDGWGVTFTSTQICAVKGSTVEMSCSYEHAAWKSGYRLTVQETFWFIKDSVDLKTDEAYRGRVENNCYKKRCTLRIRDLRESDSALYKFRFTTNSPEGRYSSPTGVTLSVTARPALQVNVTRKSESQHHSRLQLKCLSSCIVSGRRSYVWFRNGQDMNKVTSSIEDWFHLRDRISCALKGYEQHRSPEVYAPKLPSVSVNSSGEIMEGSSVTLTCSSDANPAASYTWYKENRNPALSNESQLIFRSIRSSDSGFYFCTAENALRKMTSGVTDIDVKYPPKLPFVSVSPSAEIMEGSSVTLTCSSDAKPAASCTWYKENQTLLQGQRGIFNFPSISSEDRGIYYCRCENKYGFNSTSAFIDVQYPPKFPFVSVNPSGEITEGSSVTLTCSSDANPAANYTWYKENEDSHKAPGQTFTITKATPKHSGKYYCEARNTRGHHNSSLDLIIVAGPLKSAAVGSITVIVLVLVFLSAFLLIRRKWFLRKTSESRENPDNTAQQDADPEYEHPSAAVRREASEQQDDLYYSSVRFCKKQEDPLYSNVMLNKQEEEDVEYSVVNLNNSPGRSRQEAVENTSAIYSTVTKIHRL